MLANSFHSPQLDELRLRRGFHVAFYLERKLAAVNAFFCNNGLNAVVLGISGGVDSALTAMLLAEASAQASSPLTKIVCVNAPIYGDGTSHQEQSCNRADALRQCLSEKYASVEFSTQDLSQAFNDMASIPGLASDANTAWARGQMASVLRTPLFYFNAAILQQQGYRSLVVGTTNRDEGAYLGFFGKASDAMVDLQIIADIHKSEVYQLAEYLAVPKVILDEAPRGDVWDGKTDEQMIGAPYWFVELYLLCKFYGVELQMDGVNRQEYLQFIAAIERKHEVNKHKYEVGSPAHFIDVMDRKIPSGW